ncbi:MAG: helix-turn-helix domain-containing protein [Ruminococcus sp.]|nr:helix-turn-helix domain-containing protein [Ruminococcus sp.]
MIFSEYEDIVSVDDVMKMLHIGRSNVYKLLREKEIKSIRIGVKYIIPKKSIIEFLEKC